MSPRDRQILNEHVAFMRRMTENSKRSHGWTFDDEIAALERVLDESLTVDAENAKLLEKIDRVYAAGAWGIDHVGAANYHERQVEATQKLEAAYEF